MDNPFDKYFQEFYEKLLNPDEAPGIASDVRATQEEAEVDEIIAEGVGTGLAFLVLLDSGLLPDDLNDALDRYVIKYKERIEAILREDRAKQESLADVVRLGGAPDSE